VPVRLVAHTCIRVEHASKTNFSNSRCDLAQQALLVSPWEAGGLLHLNCEGMGCRDEIVVLCGTGHGDLVRAPAQTLEHALKPLLILFVHEYVSMRSLGALDQLATRWGQA
jgi:hypothetical protein